MTFTASPAADRRPEWLGAEPNWTLMGLEDGGLPNPRFDQLVRVYCDIATRSTFAVTVDDGLAGWVEEENRDFYSWAGYEFDADGRVWELRGGLEPDHQWWIIDDLLWGFGLDDVHNVVDRETHTIASREEMTRRCFESGLVAPAPVAREAIELHWGPLTASEEVRLGLTQSECQEGEDAVQDLLDGL